MKRLRWCELAALFIALPVTGWFYAKSLAHFVVPIVLVAATASLISLYSDSTFDRRKLWRLDSIKPELLNILKLFAAGCPLFTVLAYTSMKDQFLMFPVERTLTWIIVMVLYPVFAALSQEIIFRAFFFHRYSALFKNPRMLIIVNALLFGFAHIMYRNPVAPVLSAFGGLLFAWRYRRSKALLAVAIEHGLWGDFLFTIGLGWYFYSGAI